MQEIGFVDGLNNAFGTNINKMKHYLNIDTAFVHAVPKELWHHIDIINSSDTSENDKNKSHKILSNTSKCKVVMFIDAASRYI